LAALMLYYDVLNDKDFAGVRAHPAIQEAARLLESIRHRRIGESDTAWTIDDKTFIPEGIAFDPATNAFFVSSQYKRKIVRIESSGAVRDFATRADGLWMVFGIAVDPARRLLWAVSTAERQMEDFKPADENRTGVCAFNLDTARLVHRYDLEPQTPAHRFDDLAVLNDGRVFISDGGSGAIYLVTPGAASLRVFVAPGTIQGPNGIAPSPDGRFIYVADYAGFLFRVDTATAATMRLAAPSDVALYGIDGLAWDTGSLVGVQNGVNPERVIRLTLSEDGTRITTATILDMGNARVAEPTLGVVAGGAFYYVANSHGALLREPNRVLAAQPLTAPVILKLRLR
jgi:sugar lactone lactonase YvrE